MDDRFLKILPHLKLIIRVVNPQAKKNKFLNLDPGSCMGSWPTWEGNCCGLACHECILYKGPRAIMQCFYTLNPQPSLQSEIESELPLTEKILHAAVYPKLRNYGTMLSVGLGSYRLVFMSRGVRSHCCFVSPRPLNFATS